jgi:hypothetical protein
MGVGSGMSLAYHAVMPYQPSCIMVAIQETTSVTIIVERHTSGHICSDSNI